jgi:hypothetical protein
MRASKEVARRGSVNSIEMLDKERKGGKETHIRRGRSLPIHCRYSTRKGIRSK